MPSGPNNFSCATLSNVFLVITSNTLPAIFMPTLPSEKASPGLSTISFLEAKTINQHQKAIKEVEEKKLENFCS